MIQLPRTFSASRLKSAGFALVSLLFIPGGAVYLESNPALAFAGFAIGLACMALSLALMVPRFSSLTLTEQGFELQMLTRRHRYRWSEVDGFFHLGGHLGETVGFRLKAIRSASMLPDTYGQRAADLAQLLNELRSKYG